MFLKIALPDDIADSLTQKWGSLEQKILEMLAIEAYREGSISAGKVRELLGMSTQLEVDRFFKAKGVDLLYSETDLIADSQTHKQLRQEGKLNAL